MILNMQNFNSDVRNFIFPKNQASAEVSENQVIMNGYRMYKTYQLINFREDNWQKIAELWHAVLLLIK